MRSSSAFMPTPARISNRGLIRQMELHGWHVKKVSGEDTIMASPGGDKVTVRSAHCHTGNPPKTIQEILDIMQITWEQFTFVPGHADEVIGGVLRTVDPELALDDAKHVLGAINDVMDERSQQRAAARKAAVEEQRERQRELKEQRRAARAERQREDNKVIPMQDPAVTRQRGIADAVFGVILARSGPITNQQIADLLPDYDKTKVGSAANYLYNDLGVIDRVKRGVWQRKHEYSPHDMTFDVVSRNLDLIREQGLQIAAAAPAATVTPLRTQIMPVVTNTEDREETLNETLDLLFPGGFKAKHLPTIAAWKAATSALMDAVEEQQ